jgi:hypothetical protein
LLNQAALPNNSNPGGGENASAQVCNKTSDAAFSGMANNGSTVFVPCSDGIAAVSIDSSSSFHRVWYQTSGGGSAPILAGGLVWTLKMFGGTSLYGLDPSSGLIVTTLTLPATTNHFATPAAGDQRLIVPAGTFVAAFAASPRSDNVGQYSASTLYTGVPQVFYLDSSGSNLRHGWWNSSIWQFEALDGPGAGAANGRTSDDVGAFNSAVSYGGQLHDFYFDSSHHELRHAWWTGSTWFFETLDGVDAPKGNGQTTDSVGSYSTATVYGTQLQVWYYDGSTASMRHAWWDQASWHFEALDGNTGGVKCQHATTDPIAGGVSSSLLVGGQPHVLYWDSNVSGTGHTALRHAWWTGASWMCEFVDGGGMGIGLNATTDNVGQYASTTIYGGYLQVFYSDGSTLSLRHGWLVGTQWTFEYLDGPNSATNNGRTTDHVGRFNATTSWNGELHAWYVDDGPNPSVPVYALRHARWTGSAWNFETLDGPGAPNANGQTSDQVGNSYSAQAVYGYGPQVWYWDSSASPTTLRHAWWVGSRWGFETLE